MRIFILILFSLLLCGCIQENREVCNAPYVSIGDACCLDTDSDGVCDIQKTTTTTTTTTSTTTTSTSTSTTSTTSTSLVGPRSQFTKEVVTSPWASIHPMIDGIKSEGEWGDAKVINLSEIDRLHIKNNNDHLFFLYEVWDKNKFYIDSAIYLDPDSNGLYNYAYVDRRVFLVLPLFKGFEAEPVSYCRNPLYGTPQTNCGLAYEHIIKGSRIMSSGSSTSVVSEVAVPLNRGCFANSGESVFFWIHYGHPNPTCYPEVLQCYQEHMFAELRLSMS